MKHLKLFNESFYKNGKYYDNKGFEIRKSTNFIYRIDKEDIIDIMVEITDNFEMYKDLNQYGFKISNDKEVILDSLVKNVVNATFYPYIPDDKMDFFKKCLKQAEKRFHGILHSSYYTKLIKNASGDNPRYTLTITFNDCKLLD